MEKVIARRKLASDGITSILAFYEDGEGWEVYYKRPNFPWLFAFGLPTVHNFEEVFGMADGILHMYENYFD